MLQLGARDPDSVVLDFFSGSATTAHAVMKLNVEDGGRRKFIMVQLPEACPEGSEAAKAGYANICEIGKERIRRAGEKVKEEFFNAEAQMRRESAQGDLFEAGGRLSTAAEEAAHEDTRPPDVGFRVYKLDTSNVVAWNPNAADLEKELQNAADNILLGRTAEDLFAEVLLKSNIPLTAEVAEQTVGGCTIRVVNGGELFVCLDAKIGVEVAEEIARLVRTRRDASLPWSVVFRETGFVTDEDKANALTTLKSVGVESVRTI